MKRNFRKITDTDYEVISDVLSNELKKYSWADKVAVRGWCIDECNRLSIQWLGKGNEKVIPTLTEKTMEKAIQKKVSVRVLILNMGTERREYRKFCSRDEADKFFETRKNKSNLVCESREKYFTYRTKLGTKMIVQKMY